MPDKRHSTRIAGDARYRARTGLDARVVVIAAAVLLAATSCRPEVERRDEADGQRPRRVNLPPALKREGGVLYLVVNEDASSTAADLYKLDIDRSDLERITKGFLVSQVTACPTMVMINAAGPQRGGFAVDTVRLVKGRKIEPVPRLGTPQVLVPGLAPDCRLVYVDRVARANSEFARLKTWDPTNGRINTIFESDGLDLFDPQWISKGRVAVVKRKEQAPSRILILSRGRRLAAIPTGIDGGKLLASPQGDWIVLANSSRDRVYRSLLINVDTTRRKSLNGWLPRAWTPDGEMLLVVSRGKWGLTRRPAFDSVTDLGKPSTHSFDDAAWLTKEPAA